MTRVEMETRTKKFALRIIKLASALPRNNQGSVLGRQILKAGTSVGANYREAGRASSKRHFVTTLEIAQREAQETQYWLELIAESGLMPTTRMKPLITECDELNAILTTTIKTAKQTKP